MLPYSKGAALVIKTLKSLEDAQQTIWTARALIAIIDLSPVESMLAQALCSDSVWPETMRTQLRQAESGAPGYAHLQGQLMSTGFYLRVLLPKVEQAAMMAGDTEIAERHLARALVDLLNADLRRQAINGERLVAEVSAMEKGPTQERITQAVELERFQFAKAHEEMVRTVGNASTHAQADFSRRGLGGSGMQMGSIIEAHVSMLKQMATKRVEIRKDIAQTVREMASKSELARLREEIDSMIDAQWTNLHIGVARYLGGPSVEKEVRRHLDSGQWADTPMVAKSLAARELEILEREASLGVASATAQSVNINVDRSVIGAINTGVMQNLDVAMTNILAGGDEQLADALRRMTESVIQSTDLATEQKNEALDYLAFIAEQAARSKEQRSVGALKTNIAALERVIQISAALLALWQQFGQRIIDLIK